ncbi:MAG: flagellar protein FlaG [Cellvibrionaceae bacterium]
MNEVTSQAASRLLVGGASSQGTVNARQKPAPEQPAKGASEVNPKDASAKVAEFVEVQQKELEQAVTKMNDFIQKESRDLHFSIDDESGHTVVRVLDRGTGETIRQIPNEDFLHMARLAKANEPVSLISVHG